jgi:hypothetical protein
VTATARRTGWLVIAVLAALATVEPVTRLLNGPPSEGPWPFCETVATSVIGVGWWLASRRPAQTEE